ncbi:MAG: hypothetical protein MUF49_30030, partial [Oculatellaceae cyanobacterium Prado106]|nr:hypothetical protein [Oculatellaceae cyanobacterium Prado106]
MQQANPPRRSTPSTSSRRDIGDAPGSHPRSPASSHPIQPLKIPPKPTFHPVHPQSAPLPNASQASEPHSASPIAPIRDELPADELAILFETPLPETTVKIRKPRPAKPRVPLTRKFKRASKSLVRQITQRRRAPWEWAVLGLVTTVGIFSGVGTSALLWLTHLPAIPQCQTVTPQSSDVQRLYCAQELAHSGKLADLIAGIHLLQTWEPQHPLRGEVRRLMREWSNQVLEYAQTQIERNDFPGAVATAAQIPLTSPVYQTAQTTIAHWQTQWHQGETFVKTAQTHLKQQQWTQAWQQVSALKNLEASHWRVEQVDVLSQQILQEQEAQRSLKRAILTTQGNGTQQLGEAIATLQSIPVTTYTATSARSYLQKWCQTLVQQAFVQWQKGDQAGALAIAAKLPTDPQLSAGVQDLIRFSQAQQLVKDSQRSLKPHPQQIWLLMEALAAVRQVSPASAFYPQAKANQQNWEAQLQNLTHLQIADWVANLGHRPQLEWAVTQAQQVAPGQPRRVQAQTLVAQWRRQIERQDNSHQLAQASRVAQSKTLSDLYAAIAQAQKILLGQALRQ